jgi:hypothetical protein
MPLPNSGISVRSSNVWWQEKQNMRAWTAIDVATPYRFADYAAGRDAALSAALGHQQREPLGAALLSAAKAGGTGAVLKAVEVYRLDPAYRYDDLALHISRAAEFLQGAKRPEEALLVAEVATRHYPNYRDAFLLAFLQKQTAAKSLHGRRLSAACSSILTAGWPAR